MRLGDRLSPARARGVIAAIVFSIISVWVFREWVVLGRPPGLQYLLLYAAAGLLSVPSMVHLLRGTPLPDRTRYTMELTGFAIVVLVFFLASLG